MLIRDFRQGRGFWARLNHGTDIIGQINDLAKGKKIETGILSAIGALSRAELGYYDQVSKKYGEIRIDGPVELVYFSGNISLRDGQPFVHAHAVLSDREGKVWGGHLNSGTVFAAELYMQELLGLPLQRVPDSITGLNLWSEE
ncbi:MAG TPA: PPC domain-containing DNA-binding protein [Methanothrix sp.]